MLERLQAAEARVSRLEADRDEWRTKAMDVDRHPVVVALRREKHDLANRVVGSEDTVYAIRLEFERRDMDATDPIQAVRDVIEGFMSRTVALAEAREQRDAQTRGAEQVYEEGRKEVARLEQALTEAREKLQALELVAEAARQTDEQGHHDGCSALDENWADGCTCPLLTIHDALASINTKAVSHG